MREIENLIDRHLFRERFGLEAVADGVGCYHGVESAFGGFDLFKRRKDSRYIFSSRRAVQDVQVDQYAGRGKTLTKAVSRDLAPLFYFLFRY